jgi:predicted RNA-binding Zn-ribbon protein involved in translation (DUF1610 family)
MDDRHLDGNATAGLLSEALAVDATAVVRRCHSCGSRRPIADHRAYRGAGAVLRCPDCGDVALRIAVTEDWLGVEVRGTLQITRPEEAARGPARQPPPSS